MALTDVPKAIDGIQEWQEELYRHFHHDPELSLHGTGTAAEITCSLDQYGYQTQQIGGWVVGVLHRGVDPVVWACSIVMRLQTLVSREVDPSCSTSAPSTTPFAIIFSTASSASSGPSAKLQVLRRSPNSSATTSAP